MIGQARKYRSVNRIFLEQIPGLSRELARVKLGMWSKRPVVPWKLEFFLTYSCGSRCKTCLIWTRYDREPEKRAQELDANAFARVARSVGPSLRWLSFTGGEITDREDAEEIMIAVGEGAPGCRVISSSSHGLSPHRVEEVFEGVARRFPDRAILVTLSMDGLGKTYKDIRGVSGADQVFESYDRLELLSKKYPNLGASFQTTLSERNFGEARELLEVLAKRSPGNVVTIANDSRVLTEGKIPDIDARDSPAIKAALEDAIHSNPARGLSGIFSQIYLRLTRGALEINEAPVPCVAGFASLTISPYGEVLQCDRHDEPLGVLEAPDYDLSALIRSENYMERLEKYRGCRECFTPCQAYPSIMHAPMKSSFLALTRR